MDTFCIVVARQWKKSISLSDDRCILAIPDMKYTHTYVHTYIQTDRQTKSDTRYVLGYKCSGICTVAVGVEGTMDPQNFSGPRLAPLFVLSTKSGANLGPLKFSAAVQG